jgi:hypothetical protein
MIYDSSHTGINSIQNDFNTIHPNMKFTAETESQNKINFLGVTIHRTPTNWKISIYRKPSFTDTIIPYSSNQPTQHKHAGVRFLHIRLDTYHLHKDEYNDEVNIIREIMSNNGFPIHTHKPPTIGHPTNTANKQTSTHTQKWAAYIGKETKYITNLFKRPTLI